MSFPGLLVAAGEAAAITGAFELAKSKIGNMASGGSVRQSGYYRVGEQGPEDVFMLRGSQVMNAIQTKNISNATTNSVTVNVLGSNGRVVETLRASLRSGSGDSFVRDLKQALAVA
jgi:SLT domain-containing protein